MKIFILSFLISFCLPGFAEVIPSDSYLDFSEVQVGETEYLEFELQNTHPFSVSILSIDLNADFRIFDLNENCLGTLDAGDSCYIEVSFTPDEVDNYWGKVEVETSTKEFLQISLEGEGVW